MKSQSPRVPVNNYRPTERGTTFAEESYEPPASANTWQLTARTVPVSTLNPQRGTHSRPLEFEPRFHSKRESNVGLKWSTGSKDDNRQRFFERFEPDTAEQGAKQLEHETRTIKGGWGAMLRGGGKDKKGWNSKDRTLEDICQALAGRWPNNSGRLRDAN